MTITPTKAEDAFNIPYLDDAKLFAKFTDELPAVINYYTSHNEQEIINFYQEIYGETTHSEIKRGRLTLTFKYNDKQLRVIISPQENKRQVDVLLQ